MKDVFLWTSNFSSRWWQYARWVHAWNLDEAHIKEISPEIELPDVMIDAALRESSYPRLESKERWCAFSVSLPGGKETPRTPILLLVCEQHLLSLALHDVDIQARPAYEDVPWGTRCALHVIRTVLAVVRQRGRTRRCPWERRRTDRREAFVPAAAVRGLDVGRTRPRNRERNLVAPPEPLPPTQAAEVAQLHADRRDGDDFDLVRSKRDGGKARDDGLAKRHGRDR